MKVRARTLAYAAVVAGTGSHARYSSDEKVVSMANYVVSEKGEIIRKRLWEKMREDLVSIFNIEAVMGGMV